MSKKLEKGIDIEIAPEIIGFLDDNCDAFVRDNRMDVSLDPTSDVDKITIYERQVQGWFLEPGTTLLENDYEGNRFIVLMICLSYLEGVQQYREGRSSQPNHESKTFFVKALQRIYPSISDQDLRSFYDEARCGLFHNGMVGGRIILNDTFADGLAIEPFKIKVNPGKLLDAIKSDFRDYILELRSDTSKRHTFACMYSNI
jgi:hypothetical protein